MTFASAGRIVLAEWKLYPAPVGHGPIWLRHEPCRGRIVITQAEATLDQVLILMQEHYKKFPGCARG